MSGGTGLTKTGVQICEAFILATCKDLHQDFEQLLVMTLGRTLHSIKNCMRLFSTSENR